MGDELKQSGPTPVLSLVRDAESVARIAEVFAGGRTALLVGSNITETERARFTAQLAAWKPANDAHPEILIPTSGTTAAPKIARLPHAALAHAAAVSCRALSVTATSRWLLSISPARVGGLMVVLRARHADAALIVDDAPSFEARAFAARLGEHGVTHTSIVPTMLARLVGEGIPAPSSLECLLVGGAALSAELRARAASLGYPVVESYGMTETCAFVALRRAADAGFREVEPGTVRVADGALEVRGPSLFAGYVGGAPLAAGQWWRTRDLGTELPDGAFEVSGREDDLIVTGGEKVNPEEVEAVLRTVPGVKDAVVFGAPDAEWGSKVAALLVGEASIEAARAACARALAKHKCPRLWAHATDIPRGAAGKVSRRTLAGQQRDWIAR